MVEVNFDGLVGPSHNFAGLSDGNVASTRHRGRPSNPRRAALQGLAKSEALASRGVAQAWLPPHERPNGQLLHALGLSAESSHALVAQAWSAAAMWTANAATVSPSADSGRVNFTPANLSNKLHRSIETAHTSETLKRIFASDHFVHHAAAPATLGDEGAANHTRLLTNEGAKHLFVFGKGPGSTRGTRFDARQHRWASEAIARHHGIFEQSIFLSQQAKAIDAGVFHNDVIAVGFDRLYVFHESAYDTPSESLQRQLPGVRLVEVSAQELSLENAVTSYLFNSQIVRDNNGIVWVAPEAAAEGDAHRVVQQLLEEGLINDVIYMPLRESMNNGGGPACLRLRVELSDAERLAMHQGVVYTPERCAALKQWVETHYRDRLTSDDLRDPRFREETRVALDALTTLLALGSDFYPFQRE